MIFPRSTVCRLSQPVLLFIDADYLPLTFFRVLVFGKNGRILCVQFRKSDMRIYVDPLILQIVSNNPHVITIEKMLVDMYCDKLIQSTYSKAEYPSVLEQVIKTYKVEKPKMLRYAGRRNKAAEIKKILAELD